MDNTQQIYPRFLESGIRESMTDTPVTLIAGPRQSGKTTLAQRVASRDLEYLTLDDETTLLAARSDPVGFVRNLDRAVIDEIQRAPGLLPAIKKSVDEDRRPGRFLLTGSANLMALPTVTESLAGRMETLVLLPLSQAELAGTEINWLDLIFEGEIPTPGVPVLGPDLVETVVRGGYPEAVARHSRRRRTTWFRQYVAALIQRDVHEIANIDKLGSLPQFLNALASIAGQSTNYSQLGGRIGFTYKTAAKYISIFEQMFILRRLEAWSTNKLSRITKAPKIHFIDSGILSTLNGMTHKTANIDRKLFGTILETFIYGELLKQTTCSEDDYHIYHFRERDRYEVDFVIENAAGELVGVEVKAGATVHPEDLRGMKRLADYAGGRMKMGVILYDGDKSLPLGDNIRAVPISSLWGG